MLITKYNYKSPSGLFLISLGTKKELPFNSLVNVLLQFFLLGKIADKSSTGILLAAK